METPTKFEVTKRFTAGALAGLTITEVTSVRFTVGKTYRECIGTGRYRVEACRALGVPMATDANFEYWLHKGEVYRVAVGNRGPLDVDTLVPGNARWECSAVAYERYFGARA